jgi:hypothetical protein
VVPAYRRLFKSRSAPPMKARDDSVGVTIIDRKFLIWYREHKAKPVTRGLDKALKTWADVCHLSKGWGLDAEWIYEPALQTIRAWETNPSLLQPKPRWVLGGDSLQVPLVPPFQFYAPFVWNPLGESRTAAKRRLSEEFDQQLGKHLEEAEAALRSSGLTRRGRWTRRHFDWLVKRLVLEDSVYRVAKHSNVDRRSVREGVATAAARLGLDLEEAGLQARS